MLALLETRRLEAPRLRSFHKAVDHRLALLAATRRLRRRTDDGLLAPPEGVAPSASHFARVLALFETDRLKAPRSRSFRDAAAESEFEAHHRDPLSTSDGIRQSRLADFALVCASCHRLIHAVMRHEARTVSVGEFSARLERPLPSNG